MIRHYMPRLDGSYDGPQVLNAVSVCGLSRDPDRGTAAPERVTCVKCKRTGKFRQDTASDDTEDAGAVAQGDPVFVLHRVGRTNRRTLIAVCETLPAAMQATPFRLTGYDEVPEGRRASLCHRATRMWEFYPTGLQSHFEITEIPLRTDAFAYLDED